MQRFSCNSAEQFGQKRDAASESELIAAALTLELPEAMGSDSVRFIVAETYHSKPALAITIPDSSGNPRVLAMFDFMAGNGHTAAPGITDDAPSAQATPGAQELSGVADGSVPWVK